MAEAGDASEGMVPKHGRAACKLQCVRSGLDSHIPFSLGSLDYTSVLWVCEVWWTLQVAQE